MKGLLGFDFSIRHYIWLIKSELRYDKYKIVSTRKSPFYRGKFFQMYNEVRQSKKFFVDNQHHKQTEYVYGTKNGSSYGSKE